MQINTKNFQKIKYQMWIGVKPSEAKTDKTSQLKNAIEEANEFCFRWTWTCCKSSNKLKNLTWRNTKKQQNREMQSMQNIELLKAMWSIYPTESPSW
jgi:hypothetical protein